MGANYYCEYCCKRMKNDLNVRKKHLDGLPHKIARAEYMAAFRDPEEILQQEFKKTPCSRFHTGKECKFGLFCHYSHYTKEQLDECQQLVILQNNRVKSCNKRTKQEEKLINDWLWNYPYDKVKEIDLPPSLQPINLQKVDSSIITWG